MVKINDLKKTSKCAKLIKEKDEWKTEQNRNVYGN